MHIIFNIFSETMLDYEMKNQESDSDTNICHLAGVRFVWVYDIAVL